MIIGVTLVMVSQPAYLYDNLHLNFMLYQSESTGFHEF